MSSMIAGAGIHKAGTCPHGLPPGACPICSGMGGGGMSTRGRQPKAGELTWEQCYAIGQMMKAQKAAQKQTQAMFAQQAENAMLQRIAQTAAAIKTAIMNAIPPSIVRTLDGMKTLMLTPVSQLGQKLVQTIQTVFNGIAKFAEAIKEKLINITDKLAALFGETKNAIEKKLSEKFKELKKKAFNLFGLVSANNDEDEEAQRIEEQTRQMEMKEMHETMFNLKKFKEEQGEA